MEHHGAIIGWIGGWVNHRARVGILYRTPYGANKLLRGTQKVLNKDMLKRGYVKFAVALVVVKALPHSMSISIHTLSKCIAAYTNL